MLVTDSLQRCGERTFERRNIVDMWGLAVMFGKV